MLTAAVTATVTAGCSSPLAAEPGPSSARGAAASDDAPVKILPLGDSIVSGQRFGGARTKLWSLFTGSGYRIDFVGSQSSGPASLPDRDHEAYSGRSIAQMLPATWGWVRAAHPDVVMVSAGGNDMMYNRGTGIAARYPAYLDTICSAAPGVAIVVATNHQVDTRAHGLASGGGDGVNRLLAAQLDPVIRAQQGTRARGGCPVTVVDMSGVISDELLNDDLHPNAAGYAAMGQQWFPALRTAVDAVLAER